MSLLGLPFLWGSATGAYQCEGAWDEDGKGLGEWDWFCARCPAVAGYADGRVASDFYHRYEEDVALAAAGGQNSLRLSLAWSRIMPQGTGGVNEAGLAFYDRVIDACLAQNIEPNINLFHYDLPYALALRGGWSSADTIDAFEAYARVCFERFGDRVRLWSTFDEPHYYSYCATILGSYPPRRRLDLQSFFQWQYNQMLASARAVALYHSMGLTGIIGVVHNSGNVELDPQTCNPAAVFEAADFFYNRMILAPALEGALPSELDHMLAAFGTYLYRMPGDEDLLTRGKVDFLSLNIFCRRYVTHWHGGPSLAGGNSSGLAGEPSERDVMAPLFETAHDARAPHNEWGRELLPATVRSSLLDFGRRYGRIPIIVENGYGSYEMPDDEGFVADDGRIAFISETIEQLLGAKADGSDICGYYVWSTMDLYSWVNGYEKRYGLVRVDYGNDLRRIPKKSWYWLRDHIARFSV